MVWLKAWWLAVWRCGTLVLDHPDAASPGGRRARTRPLDRQPHDHVRLPLSWPGSQDNSDAPIEGGEAQEQLTANHQAVV
jgi:hypothetical protein